MGNEDEIFQKVVKINGICTKDQDISRALEEEGFALSYRYQYAHLPLSSSPFLSISPPPLATVYLYLFKKMCPT